MDKMAMSTAQKNLLTRNRVHLVNNIHPAAVCDYLREDHHITESMQEDIMLQRTTKEKVGKLLDTLIRRPGRAFDAFVYALVMTEQEHAAEVLDRSRTRELVRQRDEARGLHNNTIAQASSVSSPGQSVVTPSGSPVVTSSSSGAHVPSSCSASQQYTPTPSATSHSSPVPSTSAAGACGGTCVPGTSAAEPSSLPGPIQAMDTDDVSDVADVIDAVVNSCEGDIMRPELSQHTGPHCCPDDVIEKGYAVIIQNTAYNKQEFSTIIGSVEVSQFFEQCGFKTELCTDFTAQKLKQTIEELRTSASLGQYDALVLFFMGCGDYEGQLYATDGLPVSIKTDILQNFNSENCPALRGKPKIFCFQIAKPGSPAEVPMDNVDSLAGQLSPATELWSDMIIFSSVTPTKLDYTDFDRSNYMHRALVGVALKFAHKLSVYDILRKVQTILQCQKVGSKGIHTELYHSPQARPVYLQLGKPLLFCE